MQPELNGQPVVLYAELPRYGLRVAYCSPAAVRAGVRVGVPLAEAQSLLERGDTRRRARFHLVLHDPAADREFLEGLAEHCQRYSPLVGIDEFGFPETLVLDITGCAEHFGGELPLARSLLSDLSPFIIRVGIADTIGAAWGAARFDMGTMAARERVAIIAHGEERKILAHYPIDALRLPREVLEPLDELGLRKVAQLLALPRASLPSRFGPILTQRLDQALGAVPEIIVPIRVLGPVEAEWSFESPVSNQSILETALRHLLSQLLGTLEVQRCGLQRLEIRLFCAGGEERTIHLGSLRPSASREHWLELLRLQLERLALPGEILRLHLETTSTARLEVHTQALFDDSHRQNERALLELLDRLSTRLGEDAVLRPELQPDAQPEFACRLIPLAGSPFIPTPSEEPPALNSLALTRPLLLKQQPIPIKATSVVPDGPPKSFEWEGELHTINHWWGPERIETGWWRGPSVARDYYRVETPAGRRFWIFRNRDSHEWFLHGIFE